MADITISELELAPALADDMVFPVENLTDTYAATLAMLRRILNKTFVEEEDADFNDLTNDGFYQCTGTPTNAPVAGTIDWTLQVSSQGGVTVQRAYSLDDDYANIYIRRWNGVTWTTWQNIGKGALDGKANIDASNFNLTGKSYLSGIGMPSNRYIELTPGASGTIYTAPANGWFCLDKALIQNNYIILGAIDNNNNEIYSVGANYEGVDQVGGRIILPVKKDTKVIFSYIGNGIVYYFRFVYAEGEK